VLHRFGKPYRRERAPFIILHRERIAIFMKKRVNSSYFYRKQRIQLRLLCLIEQAEITSEIC